MMKVTFEEQFMYLIKANFLQRVAKVTRNSCERSYNLGNLCTPHLKIKGAHDNLVMPFLSGSVMAKRGFLVSIAVFSLFFYLAASSPAIPDEDWNYVKVRENAFMFWWLYGAHTTQSQRLSRPLIMWLQGGPGGSSTGFGNFEELGPLTVNLTPRNTTWLRAANVLFVDNPVGAGYSYVTDKSAFTTNVTCKYQLVSSAVYNNLVPVVSNPVVEWSWGGGESGGVVML